MAQLSLAKEPLEDHPLYQRIRTIGRGQRSFVQVALNKATGEQVAIKFIPRGWEPSHTKYVTREILNHQELSLSKHPHVVEFKEVFLTARYLAEVLEYVEGETLQVFLEKVGGKVIEGLARFIFQQLIIALDFCHRKGKVNRDIKLSNILLSIAEGQLPLVKLCDFGFSKDTYRHSEPHSQVGTALFVAPEVMQNFSGGRYDGQAADVWACGVCLFIMLFGRHPYLRPEDAKLNEQQQMIKLFQRMMQNQIEFPLELSSGLSSECLDLLGRMLKTDPNQRYTMGDIQRHIWFSTALPEGAGLMNDMFLAEDAASLSPQSQSQIEALVALAAKLEDMTPTRVQLPSQLPRVVTGNVQPPQQQQQLQPHMQAQLQSQMAAQMQQQLQQQLQPQMQVQMQLAAGMAGAAAGNRGVSSGGLSQGGANAGRPPLTIQPMMAGSPPLPYGTSSQPQQAVSQQGQGNQASQQPPLCSHNSVHTANTMLNQRNSVNNSQAASPSNYPTGYMDGTTQPQHMSPNIPQYSSGYPPQFASDVQQPAQHMHNSSAQQQQFFASPAQPNSHVPSPYMDQQQMAPPSGPSGVMSMIPDLDAMIMNMPETDLLQAATIDLRPYQQGQNSGSANTGGGSTNAGSGADSQYQNPMAPISSGRMPMQTTSAPSAAAHAHLQRQFINSITSLAPGSVTSMPGGTLQFTSSGNLDNSSFLGGGPNLHPVAVVDAAPFLYEGNDDDLPMVGSVSAVIPKFDWGSFNAPLLANNESLLTSNQFQISRFTRICRDVSAKLSESGRSSTPSALSPDSLQLQQQLGAMAVGPQGGMGRGTSMSSMPHGISNLSRMMQ